MMPHPWLTDTIARRFALTVFFAALITLTLIYLFALVAGPLARQPLAESGLLPDDEKLVGGMVEAICYRNAAEYFAFPQATDSRAAEHVLSQV